jgi:hypothetical protein
MPNPFWLFMLRFLPPGPTDEWREDHHPNTMDQLILLVGINQLAETIVDPEIREPIRAMTGKAVANLSAKVAEAAPVSA